MLDLVWHELPRKRGLTARALLLNPRLVIGFVRIWTCSRIIVALKSTLVLLSLLGNLKQILLVLRQLDLLTLLKLVELATDLHVRGRR